MKILFFGTSVISKNYVERLHKNNYEILVVTMPDKPALRGQKIMLPEVKTYALENNIDFIQVDKFSDEKIVKKIEDFNADIGVVVAYGKLIPKKIFTAPRFGTFNIHFSLLPDYRGAAPVQYALMNGETETGVTSFFLEENLDCGNVIDKEKIEIESEDNAETLFKKLIPLGIKLMDKSISLLQTADFTGQPQNGEPSFAPVLKKELGLVDWSKSAEEIKNLYRGLFLYPKIFSLFSTGRQIYKRIKFLEIEVIENTNENQVFGKIESFEKGKGFVVNCGKGSILVLKVQPENKKAMSAWDFIQGSKIETGDSF